MRSLFRFWVGRENLARLEALAAALLEHETLDEDAAYSVAAFEPRLVVDPSHESASVAGAGATALSAPDSVRGRNLRNNPFAS